MSCVFHKETSRSNKTKKYHYDEVIPVPTIDHLDKNLKDLSFSIKLIYILFILFYLNTLPITLCNLILVYYNFILAYS